MTGKNRLEDIFTEKPFNKSVHDKICRALSVRLKSSDLYDTVLASAEYYKNPHMPWATPNKYNRYGDLQSDADTMGIARYNDVKKIIYIEAKSSGSKSCYNKGNRQLWKAKKYFNKYFPEFKFYGFLAIGDYKEKGSDYKIMRKV